MGGGVSKQKSRKNLLGAPATENRPKSAVSLHARENIDTFLIFLEEQSFVQVTRAATKIQSCYRRVLAKKVHATLKEHSVSIHEAAARYLENMKDSSKVNRRKTGLRSSRLISSFSQPSKETADVILSYGSKKENEEASPFSFPNQSEKGSAKSASSSMLRPLSVPNPQTEELPEDDGNKDLETNKIVKEEVIEPRTSVKTSVSANRSRKFRFQGGGHSVKGSVRSPRFDTERSMTSVVEVEEEGFGPDDMAIIASGIDDDEEGTFEKIYPMIGYVIKTRFLHSQRKVFINVCHNASVDRIICSPFREYIDTSHYDDDGYVQSISVAICDILIPSNEFHKAFMFQEGVGLVVKVPPNDERLEKKSKLKEKDMKAVLAEKCLAFLNGLSHCLDEDNPPISGLTDCEDYTVDESYYRLPKMKKMYYGALPLFYYNKKEQILDYYQPLSWNYLVKQMPGSVNRHPMPETYFNHYFIDPFTAQNSEKEDVTNASVDDSKRRVFPPDVQYPMALSYQCLKGEFEPKHPMKSNHGVLAGSTASSMRLDILSSSATVSNNAENNKLQKTPRRVPGAASKRPFSNNLLDLDNDDDDDDIPAHQKLYLESLSKLKTGYPVYMDLSFGIMSLYLTRSGTSAPPGTSLINSSSSPTNNPEQPYVSVPYGETFVARIALSNYVFSTSYDATNVIFYLHLEAEYTPEHSQYNQFLMSHYINEVSENIDLKQLTFQFSEFTELMTMQLIIERHAFYCNYCSSYASSLLPSLSQSIPALEKSSSFREKENKAVNNVTSSSSGRAGSAGSGSAGRAASASLYSYGQIRYDGAPVSHQPASKFFSLVERFSLFPVTRQRRYFKVDRGLIGVFEDDMKITPNWKNALEIIPLTHKRFEVVWHRKIVRLRKVMTKLFLIDERSKRIREFFFKGEGEGDQELQGILTCMTQHIQYANAQPFRYQYHYLEALGLLRRPITANAVSSSPSSELLTVHGFSSQIQIFVPEPHTSDDDSDIDDPSAMSLQDSDDIHDILTLPGDDHINVLHTSSEALIPAPPAPSSILKSGGVAAHRLVNQRSQGSAVPKKEARIVYGSYFRLIRTKTRMRATVKGEPESTGEEAVDSDDDDAKIPNNLEEIIDHWQQRLSEQFGAFSKYFFHCRLYYLEELDLLLILQDYKLISLMRISKILEKPTLSSISGTGASSTSAVMAGAGSNTSNSLALITSNILRRNSTPMKILNKPKPTFPPSIVPSPQPSPVQHQHSSPHIQNLASSSLGASMSSLPHISTNQPSNKTEGKVSSKSSLRLAQGLAPSGISSKLYNLDSDESDDEDDANSDRDYEEDDIITNFNTYLANKQTHQPGNSNSNRDNDHSSRNSALSPSNVNSNNKTDLSGSPAIWIFKVLSYDGRTYRFKFHEKSPYDKLTKFFYQHCIKPVVKRDLSFLKVNELQTVEPALPDIVIDNEGTRKYVRLLRPNEKVIAFGTVLKHEKTVPIASSNSSIAVPKQRRVLLVTDAPRMIFIDTIGSIVRGHVELQADGKNQVKVIDGSDFEVSINNTVHRFTSAELPDKDPNYWTLRIKQALSLANK